jgi:imidazolonepropionase
MQVYRGIKKLLTLQGAAQKSGRHVLPDDLCEIKNAAILEDKGKVLWVGPDGKLAGFLKKQGFPAKKVREHRLDVDCVLPAFLDCHTHLIFAGDRKNEFELRNQGMSYQQIAEKGGGIRSTVKATRAASIPALQSLAEDRLHNFLRQGVTTVEIKSGYGLSHKDEIKILKVAKSLRTCRVVATYLGPHAVPPELSAEDYLNEIIDKTLPEVRRHKLADRVDMFVEKGYFSVPQAEQFYGRAKDLGFQLCGHTDQLNHTGASVALAEMGAMSVDHLVQITSEDIARLGKSSTTCVLLPTSDFYLRIKYPPARALIAAGARVALSTDFNPGTAPSQDISLLGVLARLEMQMTLPEVIAALTVGGAHALGLESQLGSLRTGALCDFVGFGCDWRDLFYQVGQHPVIQVIQRGKPAKLSKSQKS